MRVMIEHSWSVALELDVVGYPTVFLFFFFLFSYFCSFVFSPSGAAELNGMQYLILHRSNGASHRQRGVIPTGDLAALHDQEQSIHRNI